jgi:hypothetical protein
MKQKLLIALTVILISALGAVSWSVIQLRNLVEAYTREAYTREIRRQAFEAEARRQEALARDRAEAKARADDLNRAAEAMSPFIGDGTPSPTPEKTKER